MKKITKDGREVLTGKHWLDRREDCAARSMYRCDRCGISTQWGCGEVHHKIKRGMGGGFRDDRLGNLEWLCLPCHREEELSGNRTKMQGLKDV